jgi:hypothetical protein
MRATRSIIGRSKSRSSSIIDMHLQLAAKEQPITWAVKEQPMALQLSSYYRYNVCQSQKCPVPLKNSPRYWMQQQGASYYDGGQYWTSGISGFIVVGAVTGSFPVGTSQEWF